MTWPGHEMIVLRTVSGLSHLVNHSLGGYSLSFALELRYKAIVKALSNFNSVFFLESIILLSKV